MTGKTAAWVEACYQAIDAAAEGKDPSRAVEHLPADEAERALAAALPVIEKVGWISEAILDEPSRSRRRLILEAHTRRNRGVRKAVEARVKRLWSHRRSTA